MGQISRQIICCSSHAWEPLTSLPTQEGNILATTFTVEVPLPDDDPSAMVLIFKAMHMRISSLPSSLDIASVKQLASAVDKYDCAGPLAPMTHYWIQRRLQAIKCDLAELYELVHVTYHVTYLLQQEELFGQVGIRLVLKASSPIRGDQTGLIHAYCIPPPRPRPFEYS